MAITLGLAALSLEEANAFVRFCQEQPPSLPRDLLLRCLFARKLDPVRASALVHEYMTNLVPVVDPASLTFEQVAPFLLTGAFVLTGGHDRMGAAIVEFDVAIACFQAAHPHYGSQLCVFLMEKAGGMSLDTNRHGVTLLSDLSGTTFKSLDHAMHKLLLGTLQNRYPMRVSHILVTKSPWFTTKVIQVSLPFMKKKLLHKVKVLKSADDLAVYIDESQLTPTFGGTLDYNHALWCSAQLSGRPVVLSSLSVDSSASCAASADCNDDAATLLSSSGVEAGNSASDENAAAAAAARASGASTPEAADEFTEEFATDGPNHVRTAAEVTPAVSPAPTLAAAEDAALWHVLGDWFVRTDIGSPTSAECFIATEGVMIVMYKSWKRSPRDPLCYFVLTPETAVTFGGGSLKIRSADEHWDLKASRTTNADDWGLELRRRRSLISQSPALQVEVIPSYVQIQVDARAKAVAESNAKMKDKMSMCRGDLTDSQLAEIASGPQGAALMQLPSMSTHEKALRRADTANSHGFVKLALTLADACLTVRVVEARAVPPCDANGLADPYVKGYLLPDVKKTTKRKTSVQSETLNPMWNEDLVWDIGAVKDVSSRTLALTLWDHDPVGNDFIGATQIPAC